MAAFVFPRGVVTQGRELHLPAPNNKSPFRPLRRSFFARNAIEVAPDLVGCVLLRRSTDGLRAGRIVETEAYIGEHDLACHARAGRTARTDVMYGEPGHAYVYLIYGVHPMLKVQTGVPCGV